MVVGRSRERNNNLEGGMQGEMEGFSTTTTYSVVSYLFPAIWICAARSTDRRGCLRRDLQIDDCSVRLG